MNEGTLPNEQAAERVTNIAGWVCKTCRRFYGDEPSAEHSARYCCEKDHKCGTDGCQGRAGKPWIYCDACNKKRDLERFLELKEVEWDGDTPLVIHDDDHYFFGPEDIEAYLEEHEIPLEHLRLVVCVVEEPRSFDMNDFLDGHLPEGMDIDNPTKIEAIVDRWIEKHVPKVWTCGKTRPSLASLQKFVSEPDQAETKEGADA
jgi:hypothetical protein